MKNVQKWKSVKTTTDACYLVDRGVILTSKEFASVKKALKIEDQKEVLTHACRLLAERVESRLSFEITLETILVWLSQSREEGLLEFFLGQIFEQSAWHETCWALVEVSLTSEVVEDEMDEEIFALAVVLICEIGLNLREIQVNNSAPDVDLNPLLGHIATYLLSVSNTSSTWIRLSLMHYFGVYEQNDSSRPSFNKIMSRFGHTVLDSLFNLLFLKTSESVALQYLQDNLPNILMGDNGAQKVLHETMKFYMLKHPERFSLFVQTFAEHLKSLPESFDHAQITYARHLGMLFSIAADVGHRQLAQNVLGSLVGFAGAREQVLNELERPGILKRQYREMVQEIRQSMAAARDNTVYMNQFRSNKRGRKPKFRRMERVATINQVALLAQIETAKMAG